MKRPRRAPKIIDETDAEPFIDAEEAWFWFVAARRAANDGAVMRAGASRAPRSCEPLDIMCLVDRLHRARMLSARHLRVLARYGQQFMPPDRTAKAEAEDARIWDQALERIGSRLRARGIIL